MAFAIAAAHRFHSSLLSTAANCLLTRGKSLTHSLTPGFEGNRLMSNLAISILLRSPHTPSHVTSSFVSPTFSHPRKYGWRNRTTCMRVPFSIRSVSIVPGFEWSRRRRRRKKELGEHTHTRRQAADRGDVSSVQFKPGRFLQMELSGPISFCCPPLPSRKQLLPQRKRKYI